MLAVASEWEYPRQPMTPLDRLIRDEPELCRPVLSVMRNKPYETFTAGWLPRPLADAADVPAAFAAKVLKALVTAGLARTIPIQAPGPGDPRRAYVCTGDIPVVPATEQARKAVRRIVAAFESGRRDAMLAVLAALKQGAPAMPGPLATATALPPAVVAKALDSLAYAGILHGPPEARRLSPSVLRHLPEACAVLGMECDTIS